MAAKSAVVAPNSNARTLLIGIAVLMGVYSVANNRWRDELNLAGRANSPGGRHDRVLGHLSGRRTFCALLPDCIRAAAGSARTAEGDLWAEARGVSASVARSTGE